MRARCESEAEPLANRGPPWPQVEKEYYALTLGVPWPASGSLHGFLGRLPNRKELRYSRDGADLLPSATVPIHSTYKVPTAPDFHPPWKTGLHRWLLGHHGRCRLKSAPTWPS
jgi:hypothetical protein